MALPQAAPRHSARRSATCRWIPAPSRRSGCPAVEAAHRGEHSLEVHLPFLQTVLASFTLVPLVVGDASDAEVADILEQLWDGPETLVVVSSDLSHYLAYAAACARDARTCDAIKAFAVGPHRPQ